MQLLCKYNYIAYRINYLLIFLCHCFFCINLQYFTASLAAQSQ